MLRLGVQLLLVILSVAFFTLEERKILGYIQARKGPNKPRIHGLLVPIGDAMKLLTKEVHMPGFRNIFLFVLAPTLLLMISILLWSLYPGEALVIKFSVIWFICITALGVYALLCAGWRRNSKYAFLGAIRAIAQTISYEVRMRLFLLLWVVFYNFSLYQNKIIPPFFLFGVTGLLFTIFLAEVNRTPFDLSEGESELVRGFNTEYSSAHFVIIFLAEYISVLFMSLMLSFIFCMRDLWDLYFFTTCWAVRFIWVRGTHPRIRYDVLIEIAWKRLLPIALAFIRLAT